MRFVNQLLVMFWKWIFPPTVTAINMDSLEITLTRHTYAPHYTAGTIEVGNVKLETLEDAARKIKVMHKTAIPAGRYQVGPWVFHSAYQIRPLLKDVPNFTGVFIHPGNTADDTSGCLLVGKNQSFGNLSNSRIAYAELCLPLCQAWNIKQDVFITIVDKEDHPWYDQRGVA